MQQLSIKCKVIICSSVERQEHCTVHRWCFIKTVIQVKWLSFNFQIKRTKLYTYSAELARHKRLESSRKIWTGNVSSTMRVHGRNCCFIFIAPETFGNYRFITFAYTFHAVRLRTEFRRCGADKTLSYVFRCTVECLGQGFFFFFLSSWLA